MKNRKLQFIFSFVIAVIAFCMFSSYDKRSSSRNTNLLDQYFSEVVAENTEIQKALEAKNEFEKKLVQKNADLQAFLAYNTTYYTEAIAKANNITDSAVKTATVGAIDKSKSTYTNKAQALKNEYQVMEAANTKANGLIIKLKIITTLPKIEAYQKENTTQLQNVSELQKEAAAVLQAIAAIVKI